jgi:hypothetical protein
MAFFRSLQDVWLDGTRIAEEQQREYTSADHLRQLHGVGYEEVVKLTDPTGKKEGRYRAEYYLSRGGGSFAPDAGGLSWSTANPPPVQNGPYRGNRSPFPPR